MTAKGLNKSGPTTAFVKHLADEVRRSSCETTLLYLQPCLAAAYLCAAWRGGRFRMHAILALLLVVQFMLSRRSKFEQVGLHMELTQALLVLSGRTPGGLRRISFANA